MGALELLLFALGSVAAAAWCIWSSWSGRKTGTIRLLARGSIQTRKDDPITFRFTVFSRAAYGGFWVLVGTGVFFLSMSRMDDDPLWKLLTAVALIGITPLLVGSRLIWTAWNGLMTGAITVYSTNSGLGQVRTREDDPIRFRFALVFRTVHGGFWVLFGLVFFSVNFFKPS